MTTVQAHRIVLVEDHPMTRYGLTRLVEDTPDLDVVGQAERADRARRIVAECRPDLVILPMRLQGRRVAGVELCRRLREDHHLRILVYTAFTEAADLEAAILAGADGLVGKWAPPEHLVRAIRAVMRGDRVWLPTRWSAGGSEPPPTIDESVLTGREREVLALMLARRTNRQIAESLVVEITTVKTHVRAILRKLGLASRRDLF